MSSKITAVITQANITGNITNQSINANVGENLYLQSIITVTNNTSVKLQCATSSGAVSSFMKATIHMGSGAKATRITAIKLS